MRKTRRVRKAQETVAQQEYRGKGKPVSALLRGRGNRKLRKRRYLCKSIAGQIYRLKLQLKNQDLTSYKKAHKSTKNPCKISRLGLLTCAKLGRIWRLCPFDQTLQVLAKFCA